MADDHEDYLEPGAAEAHHETHEDEGDDEISLEGLAGEPLELATHAGLPSIHHLRYTDAEAAAASILQLDVIEKNILLNAFRIAINGSLVKFNMVDGIMDEFEDESGVDTGTSENEDYNVDGDYYSPIEPGIELDYMEYADNEAAQSAYVSSDTDGLSIYPTQDDDHVKATTKYDTDRWPYYTTDPNKSLTGLTKGNQWISVSGTSTNQRFHIDLGSPKEINKIYYENHHLEGMHTGAGVKNFTFWGSNYVGDFTDLVYVNNGTWTQLTTLQSTFDEHIDADQPDPKYIVVKNATAYRYYAFKFTDIYGGEIYMGIRRIELQTINLLSFSEDTIVRQGTYSLRVIAITPDSLNDTLTKTVDPTIDLSDKILWKFYIYSNRTGENIKVGIHDAGGTTTETTPDVLSAGEWQKVEVDISGVDNANKDAIDSIIITIVNADADNTFYIDNMFSSLLPIGNMTLVSNSTEAEANPDTVRMVLMEEDVNAITENTDIKAYASRDNGGNWVQATLADEGDYGSGKRILEGKADVSGQAADKTIKWKVTTHNNKDLKLHGIGELWS